MITARQINRLLVEFNKKGKLNMSAMKAGMTRKTAAKYVKLKDPQDPPKARHTWRTVCVMLNPGNGRLTD